MELNEIIDDVKEVLKSYNIGIKSQEKKKIIIDVPKDFDDDIMEVIVSLNDMLEENDNDDYYFEANYENNTYELVLCNF